MPPRSPRRREHRVHAMVARVSLLTEVLGGLAAPKPRRTTRARPLVLTKRADTLPGISPTSRLNPPPTPQEPDRSRIFDQPMAAWGPIDRSVLHGVAGTVRSLSQRRRTVRTSAATAVVW